jgi:hypothetical protein
LDPDTRCRFRGRDSDRLRFAFGFGFCVGEGNRDGSGRGRGRSPQGEHLSERVPESLDIEGFLQESVGLNQGPVIGEVVSGQEEE